MKQAILLTKLLFFFSLSLSAQFGEVLINPSNPKEGQTVVITVKDIQLGGCTRDAVLTATRSGSRVDVKINYDTQAGPYCTQDIFYVDRSYVSQNPIPVGTYFVYVEGDYKAFFTVIRGATGCYGTPYDGYCTQEYDPVCGCDGKTYSNKCAATQNGVYRYTLGECSGGGNGQKPDLVPSGGSISTGNCSITASVDVKNVGRASAGSFDVRVYLTTSNDRYNNDQFVAQELGTFRINSLSVGQEKRYTRTYDINVSDGTYYLSYTIDIYDEVDEFNESFDNNNGVFSSRVIRVSGCGKCYDTPYDGYCTQEYDPVCGCDGNTYSNKCAAASNGVYQSVPGECPDNCSTSAPTSSELTTTQITATSARLNNSKSNVDETDWRYRRAGNSSWVNLSQTSSRYKNLNNLQPNTKYEWQAQSVCGNNEGNWSWTESFTTSGGSSSDCKCTNHFASSFCDDFNSYRTGALGPQSSCWTTWSGREGGSEDGIVAENGGNKYLAIKGTNSNGGTQDVVLRLGDRRSGKYELKFNIWMFHGEKGYYNILHKFSPGGSNDEEWAQNVYFDGNGNGRLEVGDRQYSFRYTESKWINVRQYFDISGNTTTLYIDGQRIDTWPFSYQAKETYGTRQLSAVNYFPINRGYEFFIDNLEFDKVNSATDNSVEQRNTTPSPQSATFTSSALQLEVYPNPTDGLLSIDLHLEAQTLVEIEVFDAVGKTIDVYTGSATGVFTHQFDLTNRKDGVYFVRVKTNDDVLTKQIVLVK